MIVAVTLSLAVSRRDNSNPHWCHSSTVSPLMITDSKEGAAYPFNVYRVISDNNAVVAVYGRVLPE